MKGRRLGFGVAAGLLAAVGDGKAAAVGAEAERGAAMGALASVAGRVAAAMGETTGVVAGAELHATSTALIRHARLAARLGKAPMRGLPGDERMETRSVGKNDFSAQ